jgi:putative proteasome-type protease
MTYCVAVRLDTGILFASDSRTNAGVDRISTFSKLKVFERPGDRVLVLLCAGNLSVTQSVVHILDQHRNADPAKPSIWTADNLFDVATLVGDALREVQQRDGSHLVQDNIDASASLIVGGQIKGEDQRLFNIYPQGNFIEASSDTIYFQLGESKYGKPILDRVITSASTPIQATKCVLVSFDSTIRSNISVGLPIDLLWYPRDGLRVGMRRRVEEGNPYFSMLRQGWGSGLRRVFAELQDPDWTVEVE